MSDKIIVFSYFVKCVNERSHGFSCPNTGIRCTLKKKHGEMGKGESRNGELENVESSGPI